MKRTAILLIGVGLCSCSKEAEEPPPPQPPAPATAAAPQSTVAGKPAAMKPAMLEVPADKQQLQRLIALGYSVHDTHMHPPGTKECPFDMGGGVVQ